MKTNPNCTRPDCPKEFPDKQNFCNVCGAKLLSADFLENRQPETEDYYKTMVASPPEIENLKRTVTSEEIDLHGDVDDILQLPQEAIDPMKTFIASPEQISNFSQEEKIFDIPESGDLRSFPHLERPAGEPLSTPTPPVAPAETQISEPPLEQFPFKEPETSVPPPPLPTEVFQPFNETSTNLEQHIQSTQFHEHTSKESQLLQFVKESPENLPKTIIEPFSSEVSTPHTPLIQDFQTQEKYSSEKTISSEPESPTILQKASATQSTNVKPQPKFTTAFNPQTPPAWSQPPKSPATPTTSLQSSTQNTNLALISFITGILSFVFPCLIPSIVALVTGFMAKNKADSQPQAYGGRGMAMAGMILGAVSLILSLIIIAFVFESIVSTK